MNEKDKLRSKRFIEVIEELHIGNKELKNKFKIDKTLKSKIINGVQNASIDKIATLCEEYEMANADYILTGKGNPLKSSIKDTDDNMPQQEVALASENNIVNYKLVPLLNLDAVGGMYSSNSVVGEPVYSEMLIPFTDAQSDDIALVVSGDSMSPTCPAGSKILIREVKGWREYFGFGNIFVLLLDDGRRILKEVQKYREDSLNYVLCVSHNKQYPEEELPKNKIKEVWKVIKILNERGW